jgi:hypothetical protein
MDTRRNFSRVSLHPCRNFCAWNQNGPEVDFIIGVNRRNYKETPVPETSRRRTGVLLCVPVAYVRKVLVMPTAGYSSRHARTTGVRTLHSAAAGYS